MYSYRKPLKKEEETSFFFFFHCAPSSQAGLFPTGAFLRGSSVGPWLKPPGPARPEGTREEGGRASEPSPAIVQSAKVNFFAQLFKQVARKPGCRV